MGADPVRTHPSSNPAMTLPLPLSEAMNCSSQSPHPAKKACVEKRACVNLAAASVRVLKEEDPVHISTHGPTEVSKLDPPAVKRPPSRYVDFGAANLMSNDTGGFDQEFQDDKEEDIRRRDDRGKDGRGQ